MIIVGEMKSAILVQMLDKILFHFSLMLLGNV